MTLNKLKIFAIAMLTAGVASIHLDRYALNGGGWENYLYSYAPFAITSILLFVGKKECDFVAGLIFTILDGFNYHFIYVMNSPEPMGVPDMVRVFMSVFEFGIAVVLICGLGGLLFLKQRGDDAI